MPKNYDFDPADVEAMFINHDVIEAFSHFKEGRFNGGPATVAAFWSNDYDPVENVSYGKKIASEYRDRANIAGSASVHLMSNLEDGITVKKLDDYSTTHTPKEYFSVSAAASYSYARAASGDVVVSVKGSKPESFFRCIELDVLLNNDKVTNFVIASRDNPAGRRYTKIAAYHELRDQWLESTREKYMAAKRKRHAPDFAELSEAEQRVVKSEYKAALSDLAHEIALARKTAANLPLPFSTVDSMQKEIDAKLEGKRVRIGLDLMSNNSDLRAAVEVEMLERRKTLIEALVAKQKQSEARSLSIAAPVLPTLSAPIGSGTAMPTRPTHLSTAIAEARAMVNPSHSLTAAVTASRTAPTRPSEPSPTIRAARHIGVALASNGMTASSSSSSLPLLPTRPAGVAPQRGGRRPGII